MADFSARFTGGPTLTIWRDPPLETKPSRINPLPQYPHRYHRADVNFEIEITATVDGVEGPLDSALDGRLFLGWLAEYPEPKPMVTSPPGQSSIRRFTPTAVGHYTYVLRRKSGGGIILHVDVFGG